MKYFRKLITNRKLAAIFAISMLLRSVVAVGYMLDTDPVDGSFLSIIICEGPAGINAIAGLEQNIQEHSQHHGDHENHNDHDDHAAQDHPISSCSFWSSSSHSLLADLSFFEIPTSFLSDEVIFYQSFNIHRSTSSTRFARAPPTLS
jgi:hypothetical protein